MIHKSSLLPFISLISPRSWSQMLDPLQPAAFIKKTDWSIHILYGERWYHGPSRCNKRYEILLDISLLKFNAQGIHWGLVIYAFSSYAHQNFWFPEVRDVQNKPYFLHNLGTTSQLRFQIGRRGKSLKILVLRCQARAKLQAALCKGSGLRFTLLILFCIFALFWGRKCPI